MSEVVTIECLNCKSAAYLYINVGRKFINITNGTEIDRSLSLGPIYPVCDGYFTVGKIHVIPDTAPELYLALYQATHESPQEV